MSLEVGNNNHETVGGITSSVQSGGESFNTHSITNGAVALVLSLLDQMANGHLKQLQIMQKLAAANIDLSYHLTKFSGTASRESYLDQANSEFVNGATQFGMAAGELYAANSIRMKSNEVSEGTAKLKPEEENLTLYKKAFNNPEQSAGLGDAAPHRSAAVEEKINQFRRGDFSENVNAKGDLKGDAHLAEQERVLNIKKAAHTADARAREKIIDKVDEQLKVNRSKQDSLSQDRQEHIQNMNRLTTFTQGAMNGASQTNASLQDTDRAYQEETRAIADGVSRNVNPEDFIRKMDSCSDQVSQILQTKQAVLQATRYQPA